MLQASQRLADAEPDVIAYCATSSAWLGIERDEHFCAEITRQFGIPATSSVLALLAYCDESLIHSLGLVLGYTDDLVQRATSNFGDRGYPIVAHRTFGITDNAALSRIGKAELSAAVAAVVASGAKSVCTFGTNVYAAPYAAEFEQQHGVPVIDTISVTLWAMMRTLHQPIDPFHAWGTLFRA